MEAITEALGPSVERYFKGAADMKEEGIDKVPLFRLAWDVVGTSLAGRQELYERFFFGDQQVSKSQSLHPLRQDRGGRCGPSAARSGLAVSPLTPLAAGL